MTICTKQNQNYSTPMYFSLYVQKIPKKGICFNFLSSFFNLRVYACQTNMYHKIFIFLNAISWIQQCNVYPLIVSATCHHRRSCPKAQIPCFQKILFKVQHLIPFFLSVKSPYINNFVQEYLTKSFK